MCQIYPILVFRRVSAKLIEVQTHYVAAESGFQASTAFFAKRGRPTKEIYVNTDFALDENREQGIVNDVVTPAPGNEMLTQESYEGWLKGMVRCAKPIWKQI